MSNLLLGRKFVVIVAVCVAQVILGDDPDRLPALENIASLASIYIVSQAFVDTSRNVRLSLLPTPPPKPGPRDPFD